MVTHAVRYSAHGQTDTATDTTEIEETNSVRLTIDDLKFADRHKTQLRAATAKHDNRSPAHTGDQSVLA